jgi:hypothetical protein
VRITAVGQVDASNPYQNTPLSFTNCVVTFDFVSNTLDLKKGAFNRAQCIELLSKTAAQKWSEEL